MINFSQDGIMIALSYLIPGFLINTIIAKGYRLDKGSNTQALYKFLLLSFINLIVFELINRLAFTFLGRYIVTNALAVLALRNLILPLIIGFGLLFISNDKRKDLSFESIIELIGFDHVSRTNSAWDYLFSKLSEGAYIIVTLKNGHVIYGLYGSKSYATFESNNGNSIYIEDTFHNFNENDFQSTGSGVLISGDDILMIDVDKIRIGDNR